MKTLADLEDDLALWHEEAKIHLESRNYHDGEAMTAHLKLCDAYQRVRETEQAILIAKSADPYTHVSGREDER